MKRENNYIDLTQIDSGIFENGEIPHLSFYNDTCYSFNYCLEGKGQLTVNGETFPICKGNSFFCFPMSNILCSSDKDSPIKIIWVKFVGLSTKNFLRYTNFSPTNPVAPFLGNNLLELFNNLLIGAPTTPSELASTSGQLRFIFSYYIEHFPFVNNSEILKSSKKTTGVKVPFHQKERFRDLQLVPYNKNIKTAADEDFENAIRLLILYSSDPNFSVDTIAKELSISRSTLYRRFISQTGMSPVQYLTTFRLKRATHLLINSNLSIKSIATTVGFSDALYFSRVFREYNKISPTLYRKENAENEQNKE